MKPVTLAHLATDIQKCGHAKLRGTFFVSANNNLCAKIGLLDGKIAFFRCGNRKALQAVSLLRQAGLCWYQFVPGTPTVDAERPDTHLVITELLRSDPVESSATRGKILIVDDSPTIRKAIINILIPHHYQTCEAEDGFEALSQLNNEQPDLMLLDIVMPGMDGYKVLSMTRRNSLFNKLPIIMMTGRENLLDKLKLLKNQLVHSSDYIVKPFEADKLLNKIDECLSSAVEATNTQPHFLTHTNLTSESA